MRKTKIYSAVTLCISLFACVILFGAFFFYTAKGSECDQLAGDDKLKCQELEKKAEAYRNLINIKDKQQQTLQKQMELLDKEQEKNKTDLQDTGLKTDELGSQIQELEREIDNKKSDLKYRKSMLAGLMRSYYENYQQGLLNIVLINEDFSDILDHADYVGQSSIKLSEILQEIVKTKEALEGEQSQLEEKRKEIEDLKDQLETRKKTLEANEIQKQVLLTQTKGEEERYRKLLTRVEEQKQELFNFSEAGNLAEVIASVNNYPKPKLEYWASESWYYSQRDPRWGENFIGNSKSNLKDWGCAVTSVAMVSTFYGNRISPNILAKQPIYAFDLIKWNLGGWSSTAMAVDSVYGSSHGNINWSVVDKMIASKIPVVVNIRKTNGKGGHYVVIHNKDKTDYVVHDPYFGSNIYLNTTRALMGTIGDKSSTVVDQMIIYKK